MQNDRLNHENQSLLESKIESEKESLKELEELRLQLDKSKQETKIISEEYDNLRMKIKSKQFDQICAWKSRETVILEEYSQMESKLKAAISRNQELQEQFKHQ